MTNFKRGDKVTLRYHGQNILGEVILASACGVSLYVQWDHLDELGHGGAVFVFGGIPILRGDDGVYRCLLDDEPVTLEPLQ